MSELCLVTSGLWCYSKCQSQECHLGGRGMTLFTMCGAFLSKQCWVRSARWSAVMDASPGAAETPAVSSAKHLATRSLVPCQCYRLP